MLYLNVTKKGYSLNVNNIKSCKNSFKSLL